MLAFSHLIPPVQNIAIFFSLSIFSVSLSDCSRSLKFKRLRLPEFLKVPIRYSNLFLISIIRGFCSSNVSHSLGSKDLFFRITSSDATNPTLIISSFTLTFNLVNTFSLIFDSLKCISPKSNNSEICILANSIC